MNFTVYDNDDLLNSFFKWHFKQQETEIFQNYVESGKLVRHYTSNTATNVPMSILRVFIIIHNIGTFDFFLQIVFVARK